MLCAGCVARPVTSATDAHTSIEALLTSYATALRSNNAAALRAVLSPENATFISAQLRLQANLAGLRTDMFGYRPAADVRAGPGGTPQQWRVDAELLYAVSGVDTVAVRRPVTIGVRRDNDVWRLVDASAIAAPWQFGPVVEMRKKVGDQDAVVLGHPRSQVMPRIADEIAGAMMSLSEFWGPPGYAGVLFVAAGTDAEFAVLVGGENTGGIAAAAVVDRVDSGVAVGQRVVIAPGAAALPADQFRVVLRHELFHAAARTVTADDAPRWLVEGVADYNGRRGSDIPFRNAAPTLANALAAGQIPDHLPTGEEIDNPGARRTQAYEEAWSVAQYVAETFGEPKLVQLYRDGAGHAPQTQDAVIQRALGIDEATLVYQWQSWLGSRPLR